MKVFMLCVDALEYNFVKDRDFPHLKQKRFFKVDIPKRYMTVFEDGHIEPWTPIIWKGMFTGKIEQSKPEPKPEFGSWENNLLNWLKSRKMIRGTYAFLLRKGIIKPGLPDRLGFKRKEWIQGERSIIDESTKPIVIHNPLTVDVKGHMKGIRTGFSFKEIEESALKTFQKERKETLTRLKEDWDLFVIYTKLLDVIGHLFWQRDRMIEKYYRIMDNFAGEIQENLPEGTFMVILSDHGMQPLRGTKKQGGEHSHHFFVSYSHDIVDPPKDPTDVYRIVKELLQLDEALEKGQGQA